MLHNTNETNLMKRAVPSAKIPLIYEKSNNELWDRVTVNDALIVDSASPVESLKKKVKKIILDFEEIEVTDLEVSYDLTSFFEQYPFLNISEIAKRAGVNAGLMRQYTSGVKYPSEERVKQIKNPIHEIGRELSKVKLNKPKKKSA